LPRNEIKRRRPKPSRRAARRQHRSVTSNVTAEQKEFSIKDGRVKRIAQIIHDADLGDEKFGRTEGLGLDKVLNGWAKQDLPDEELLHRGMDLIEGLYESLV
jgi:hypothetical protein